MKLLELEPKFKILELLESMVEVAEFQSSRLPNKWDAAVHMNLGRRSGHTTALKEFALRPENRSDVVIVCPNQYIANTYLPVIRSVSITSYDYNSKLRGLDNVLLIFDACTVEDCYRFLYQIPWLRTKGVVLVGCQ